MLQIYTYIEVYVTLKVEHEVHVVNMTLSSARLEWIALHIVKSAYCLNRYRNAAFQNIYKLKPIENVSVKGIAE